MQRGGVDSAVRGVGAHSSSPAHRPPHYQPPCLRLARIEPLKHCRGQRTFQHLLGQILPLELCLTVTCDSRRTVGVPGGARPGCDGGGGGGRGGSRRSRGFSLSPLPKVAYLEAAVEPAAAGLARVVGPAQAARRWEGGQVGLGWVGPALPARAPVRQRCRPPARRPAETPPAAPAPWHLPMLT